MMTVRPNPAVVARIQGMAGRRRERRTSACPEPKMAPSARKATRSETYPRAVGVGGSGSHSNEPCPIRFTVCTKATKPAASPMAFTAVHASNEFFFIVIVATSFRFSAV